MSRVLVVGAAPGSLGAQLVDALNVRGHEPITAGIQTENFRMDVLVDGMPHLSGVLEAVNPQHIMCTVGLNMPEPNQDADPFDWYRWHFETNVVGPMRLLTAWRTHLRRGAGGSELHHFAAVSSNSATVPRRGSAAYCASKAALSQALRCKAREEDGGDSVGLVVYGYEPGLLAGTPMTARTEAAMPGVPLTRMRGWRLSAGISTAALADLMVTGLSLGAALNGVLIPLDGGER